jgi:putative component of membrane protein insertase Oxa1/YidC/SpoIIIJ protein YidD
VSACKFENDSYTKKRQVAYLFEGRSAFVKYNPLSLALGGLLYLYQKTISLQIGAACPYEVSCSNFSRQCIRKYGLIKGIPLTTDRLTRCTRLALIDMVDGVDYSSKRSRIFDNPGDYIAKDQ